MYAHFGNGKKWKRRALGLFRLEKRRSRGYPAAAIHCQKQLWRREADSSHKSTGEGREAMGTGYDRESSGWIYRKKKFFPTRVVLLWDSHRRGDGISILGDTPD